MPDRVTYLRPSSGRQRNAAKLVFSLTLAALVIPLCAAAILATLEMRDANRLDPARPVAAPAETPAVVPSQPLAAAALPAATVPKPDTERHVPIELPRVAARPLRPAAFDASVGTPLDPLQLKSWDLTTPKTVPTLGGGALPKSGSPSR